METILCSLPTPKAFATVAGEIILVHRKDEMHPFVTWWASAETGGRHSGNYFLTYDEAARDFGKRILRSFPAQENEDE